MINDYDLVVIGSTLEGIYAAKKAVLLQARVALVTQCDKLDDSYLNYAFFINNFSLQEVANSLKKIEQLPWEMWQENQDILKVNLQEIKNYGQLIQENLTAENSLANLAILGVDVIYGKGEFCRLPQQAFLVNNRQLRSRNYLLATSAKYRITSNNQWQEKLNHVQCFTPDNLWQQRLDTIPEKLLIIGDSPRTLDLSQGLARLGKQVILATSNQIILPGESIQANCLLQAQLEADGVTILQNFSFKQLKVVDQNKFFLEIANHSWEAEAVILANQRLPNIKGLNLEGIGVKYLPQGIIVNEKLQTSNQSVYACGDLLGGDSLPHIAQYEVDIALKNMFSFPLFKRNYKHLPKAILTEPNLASIGITEITNQAKQKQEIYLVTQHYKSIIAAQTTGIITGWCQFIIRVDGAILGCTIIGDRAIEMINLIALMMRHKIKLNRNPIQGLLKQEIIYLTPSFTEILNQVTIAFHQQKLQRDRQLRRRLENWFHWRR